MTESSHTVKDISDPLSQPSAELLFGVVEGMPVPVVLLTPDRRIRYANTAFVQMLDLGGEHYLHKKFPRHWLASSQVETSLFREYLHRVAQSGIHVEPLNLSLRGSNGLEVSTEVHVRLLDRLGPGLDNLLLVTFVNPKSSTIQREAEQKWDRDTIEEFEEKSRILFEYAPDAYYLCDLTGHFLDINKAAEEISGIKRQEAVGQTFVEMNLLPKHQIPRATQILIKSALGKPTGPSEFTLQCKDGSTVPVEIRTYPIRIHGQVLILGIARDITERKRAEIKLQESETKYRQLHESSRDGCVAVDLEGKIVESNPAFRTMMGYTEEQLCQLTYKDITPAKWHESTEQKINKQVYKRGYSDLYEKEYIRADGTVFPIEVRTYLRKDLAGHPIGLWAIVRDITRRQKTEEGLRQSEERFRVMTDSAQDAILMMDPQGCITFYNKTAQNMFGWTTSEVLGVDLHMLITPKRYHQAYHERFPCFKHSGTGPAVGKTLELTALRKDGTEFPIEISLAGVQFGDQWHAIGIVRDITERKQAEALVLKEKAFFDSVINSMPSVFYMFDEAGQFVWWNKHLEEVSGYSTQEIPNLRPTDVFMPADQAQVAEQIAKTFAEGAASVEGEIVSKEGRMVPYFMTAVRVERNGKPYLLGFGIDITERRQAQLVQEKLNTELEASIHELERSNKELRDYAHITAHDLKAPLRGIGTLAEWLYQDYGDQIAPEGRRNLQLMRQRVGRMESLVNGILRYSEIKHDDRPVEVLDTHAIVEEVIEQIVPANDIEITIEGTLPWVQAERTRLTQVFQNLLSNAAKYINKPQGQVHIGVRDADDFWEFRVVDNGPGIEAKHFSRIFKMFQSLWPDKHPDSTGLGLAVVKKIVEMYGGKIWVESELGQGSTFFFTFPKYAPESTNSLAAVTVQNR